MKKIKENTINDWNKKISVFRNIVDEWHTIRKVVINVTKKKI